MFRNHLLRVNPLPFSQLEQLIIVDLKNSDVRNEDADATTAIQGVCPRIQSLDVSGTLLSTWHAVAVIARALPELKVLRLWFGSP